MNQKIINKIAVVGSHAANLSQATGELGGMLDSLAGNENFSTQAQALQKASQGIASAAAVIEKALKHPAMELPKDQPTKDKK